MKIFHYRGTSLTNDVGFSLSLNKRIELKQRILNVKAQC